MKFYVVFFIDTNYIVGKKDDVTITFYFCFRFSCQKRLKRPAAATKTDYLYSLLSFVKIDLIVVSCYTCTKIHKKHRYTATRLFKPGWCYRPAYAGPREIGNYQMRRQHPLTGPAKRPLRKTSNQQPRSITVHHIHARNCGGIKSS